MDWQESGTDDLTTRQFMARQMLERASAAQIYLGIVSAVAVASLIHINNHSIAVDDEELIIHMVEDFYVCFFK